MEPDAEASRYALPRWFLSPSEKTITIDGPVVFDFGGIGKGYGIDLIAGLLKRQGYAYFLVEGGGDMYGTTKRDGSAYRIALEWPGKPDTAFGIVELQHQGVAVSDSFKRRWKNWHHIIDPHARKPITAIIGCAALAPTAFAADQMTSGLFLSGKERYHDISSALGAEFVVFKQDGSVEVSQNWPGELF
jgi:FAD:protein FMN transferase